MEPSQDFSRRAFAAAGPVFLVALSVVLLLVVGVSVLFSAISPGLAWALAAAGFLLLFAGIAWGMRHERRSARRQQH